MHRKSCSQNPLDVVAAVVPFPLLLSCQLQVLDMALSAIAAGATNQV